MIRFGLAGSSARWTTGIAGRLPRTLYAPPVRSVETNTPTSVATTSLPAWTSTQSAGASGRSPDTAAMCQPSDWRNLGDAEPPTFVAIPLKNLPYEKTEHGPQ